MKCRIPFTAGDFFKKNQALFLLILFFLLFPVESSSAEIRLSSLFSKHEIEAVKKGVIFTYARIEEKGVVSLHGMVNPFNRWSPVPPVNPSDFSVVAVEKCFFRDDGGVGKKAFNALVDFGRLQGMKYYSRTVSGNRVLITESRLLSSQVIVRDSAGERISSGFLIRDNRLGLIPFKNDTCRRGNIISSVSISSSAVSRFGLKVFEPGDYHIYKYLIYDRNYGGWFYYSAQFMRVRSNIMMDLDLLKPENIGNRLRADTVHFMNMIGKNRTGELAAFR